MPPVSLRLGRRLGHNIHVSKIPPLFLPFRFTNQFARAVLTSFGILIALCVTDAEGAGLAMSPAFSGTEPRRTLHVEPSAFAPVVVYETVTERCMTFTRASNPDAETCYLLAAPDQVAFDYTRMMVSALLIQPAPRRVLIIGMGGGTLGRSLSTLVPDAEIDHVEIDPAVVRVAERYFDFQTTSHRRVHVEDGRAFVAEAKRHGHQYDLVMLDAFDDRYIPAHLITREFLLMVRDVLTPDGVVVANTAGDSPLFERETATYASVFGAVLQFPAHNRIIMATAGDLPSPDAQHANDLRWRHRLDAIGIDTRVFFQRIERVSATRESGTGDPSLWLTDANAARALK